MSDEPEREGFRECGVKAANRIVLVALQERANLLRKQSERSALRAEMPRQIARKLALLFNGEKLFGKAVAEGHGRASRLMHGIRSFCLVNEALFAQAAVVPARCCAS